MARRLLELVEPLLGETLRSMCQDLGGYPYDPVGIFCALMYGLMLGERASRRLEERCRYDVRFAHLTGGARPDHSTFCRFRRELDADGSLSELMLLVVQEAVRLELVKTGTWVADGTKVATSSSQWRRLLDKAKTQDEGPGEQEPGKARSDPQARTMKTTHGEFIEGYNLEVAVESTSGIVVAAVALSDANDACALGPLLDSASEISGLKASALVADKGFETPENLLELEERAVEGYLCPKEKKNAPFVPDDESGELRCLAGHRPTCSRALKAGVAYDVYRVSRCKGCPLMQACGGKGRQRQMAVKAQEGEVAGAAARRRSENALRCKSDKGKALQRIRGQTIELAFAFMKRDFGFRRLLLRGLAGARLELRLACTALNLRTLLRALGACFWAVYLAVNAEICSFLPLRAIRPTQAAA